MTLVLFLCQTTTCSFIDYLSWSHTNHYFWSRTFKNMILSLSMPFCILDGAPTKPIIPYIHWLNCPLQIYHQVNIIKELPYLFPHNLYASSPIPSFSSIYFPNWDKMGHNQEQHPMFFFNIVQTNYWTLDWHLPAALERCPSSPSVDRRTDLPPPSPTCHSDWLLETEIGQGQRSRLDKNRARSEVKVMQKYVRFRSQNYDNLLYWQICY